MDVLCVCVGGGRTWGGAENFGPARVPKAIFEVVLLVGEVVGNDGRAVADSRGTATRVMAVCPAREGKKMGTKTTLHHHVLLENHHVKC
jgi:hypothetical protein